MMRVEEVVRRAAAVLRDAGIDTPEHDAKLLLAEAYSCTLSDIDKAVLLSTPLNALAPSDEAPTFHASDSSAEALTIHSSAPSDEGAPAWQMGELPPVPQGKNLAACEDRDCSATPRSARYQRFAAMLARRVSREPLQYIVGHAAFRYLDLQVGPGVFIPRPETELVVQEGLDWLATQRIAAPRVVDLCAGSGAIGLSIVTETVDAEVWAVELSERTAAWTRRNAEDVLGPAGCERSGDNHDSVPRIPDAGQADTGFEDGGASRETAGAGMGRRYHLVLGDATDSNTLAELDGTVDLVVTNPPYVPESEIPEQPEVRDHDPELALYGGSPDGLLIPERIIDRAAALLRPGGLLVMEHDISQGAALVAYAQTHGFAQAHTGHDWTGRPRYLVTQRDDYCA